MNTLVSIEALVGQLSEKIGSVLAEHKVMRLEHETMRAEIVRLRACLEERDRESVARLQEARAELETVGKDILGLERERSRVELNLKDLNDRLINLARKQRRGALGEELR